MHDIAYLLRNSLQYTLTLVSVNYLPLRRRINRFMHETDIKE
jgi:hypothetical protein